jgi:glucose-6-phosphate-specific signal transduction histidine kinase
MTAMSGKLKHTLFWAPRLLTILFILFMSLFALDVFGEGYGFRETLLALFMHLIPHMVAIGILVLAWRWEWIGTVLFAALGLFYIISTGGRFDLTTYLIVSGPLFLVSILFFVGWAYRRQIRT